MALDPSDTHRLGFTIAAENASAHHVGAAAPAAVRDDAQGIAVDRRRSHRISRMTTIAIGVQRARGQAARAAARHLRVFPVPRADAPALALAISISISISAADEKALTAVHRRSEVPHRRRRAERRVRMTRMQSKYSKMNEETNNK